MMYNHENKKREREKEIREREREQSMPLKSESLINLALAHETIAGEHSEK